MAPTANPFASATQRGQGEKVPGIRNLADRLLIVIPQNVPGVENPRRVPNDFGNPGDTQLRLTADVIVCDGPVIMYGGDHRVANSDTLQLQAPCVIPGMWIFNEPVIEYVLESAQNGVPLGRVRYKMPTKGKNPYYVMEKTDDEASIGLALPLYHAYQGKTLFSFGAAPVIAPTAAPQFSAQPTWPAAQPGVVAQPMMPQAAPAFNFGAMSAPAAVVADWTLNGISLLAQAGNPWPGTHEQWNLATVQERTQWLAQFGITGPRKPTGL